MKLRVEKLGTVQGALSGGCVNGIGLVDSPSRLDGSFSADVTSECGRINVVSSTSDLKQLLLSVMYSFPGYASCA